MKKINMAKAKGNFNLIMFVVVLIGAYFIITAAIDAYKWNNGECHKCDTQVEFVNGSYDYNTNTNRFYYRCPKCGNVITTMYNHSERN